ncbi:uncharacterized protein LOC128744423 [Sabethes cyaneus]|uniref:uncharacterized protein LOC128744423 n=1 Tax=Sabethes cyaneus TaxID=53552 RepID=UPI00237D886C|nr:uncharacterized protein LOC128744423 [Sabethes cyaneus]
MLAIAPGILETVYVGNLQKTATEGKLREFFSECKGLQTVDFRLENCTYCPTKIAFLRFSQQHEANKALLLNQSFFQGKRVFVTKVLPDKYFRTGFTVIVKQLNEFITEEDVYEHFRIIGNIDCVQKPASNYAYILFESTVSVQQALKIQDRNLKGENLEVGKIKRDISVMLERPTRLQFKNIASKCEALTLKCDASAEMEQRLMVTNIPRQVPEKEILDYLEKFGKITDWEMTNSTISVMTNIGYVTYQDAKSARDAFLYGPHYFQGVGLEIYNPGVVYNVDKSTSRSGKAVVMPKTNIYLTNDEIFQAMENCGRVDLIYRLDTVNHNTIVHFESPTAVQVAVCIKEIAQENVSVTTFWKYRFQKIFPSESLYKGSIRCTKEAELSKMKEMEDLAAKLKATKPNPRYKNPDPKEYKNEVQISNIPPGTGLAQFRDYFKTCGTVTNFRETSLGFYRIVYLSFDTRVGAKLACSLNQSFMNGKRLLIHMADENLVIDPELCLTVEGFNQTVSDEDIYDRFAEIGTVTFVLRKSAACAVVCMERQQWLEPALQIKSVGRFKVIVERVNCDSTTQQSISTIQSVAKQPAATEQSVRTNQKPSVTVNQGTVSSTTSVQNYNANLQQISLINSVRNEVPTAPAEITTRNMSNVVTIAPMASRPMMSSNGQIRPNVPVRDPNGPALIHNHPPVRLSGPTGPVMAADRLYFRSGHFVSPLMQRLIHKVRENMRSIPAFTSLPNKYQFFLVLGIVTQLQDVPGFFYMQPDEQIHCLISGMYGFRSASSFSYFTYPEKLKLLDLIREHYATSTGALNHPTGPPVIEATLLDHEQSQWMDNHGQSTVVQTSQAELNTIEVEFPTSTESYDPSFQTNSAPASNQFEQEAEEEQEQLQTNVAVQSDDAVEVLSVSSDSSYIPPAPEPPQFSRTSSPIESPPTFGRADSMSPISDCQKSISLSPRHATRARSKTPSKRKSLSPFSRALLSSPLLRIERTRSKSPRPSSSSRTRHRHKSPVRVRHRSRSRSPVRVKRRSRSRSPVRVRHRSRSRSPVRVRHRSRSRSPVRVRHRSRSRSPVRVQRRSRSRSPRRTAGRLHRASPPSRRERLRYDRSPSPRPIRLRSLRSQSPKGRTHRKVLSPSLSPPRRRETDYKKSPKRDEEILQTKRQESTTKDKTGASNRIYVGNLPLDTTEKQITDVFGKFGLILKLKLLVVGDKKRATITFDTVSQAERALEMHLRIYRYHLLRVAFQGLKRKERPGFAVAVAVRGAYDEISMFQTFKLCGKITNVWTRFYGDRPFCIIDFEHRDAVRAALDTTKLNSGANCKVRSVI